MSTVLAQLEALNARADALLAASCNACIGIPPARAVITDTDGSQTPLHDSDPWSVIHGVCRTCGRTPWTVEIVISSPEEAEGVRALDPTGQARDNIVATIRSLR